MRDLYLAVKKKKRNSVSVHLSCGRDTWSPRWCYSTPSDSEGEKMRTCSKKPTNYYLLLLSAPRPADVLPDLSYNNLCWSESRQDFTHLLHNISSVCRRGKKEKKSPISLKRPDKCNKPKVYFSAPPKWVLKILYYSVYSSLFLNYGVRTCVFNVCLRVSVCSRVHVSFPPYTNWS